MANKCNCRKCEICMSELYSDAIKCMVMALEYRDPYTKGHSFRVGEMAGYVAKLLNLDKDTIIKVHIAGQLHDIGKIGIPDKILLKKGRLTDSEWQQMKNHSKIGSGILRESESLSEIAVIVEQHHERWDGYGYPNRISNSNISIGGRILAFCDAVDAMASSRAYRNAMNWDDIESELYSNLGRQFDPDFSIVIDKVINYWKENFENTVLQIAI